MLLINVGIVILVLVVDEVLEIEVFDVIVCVFECVVG